MRTDVILHRVIRWLKAPGVEEEEEEEEEDSTWWCIAESPNVIKTLGAPRSHAVLWEHQHDTA
ncbi:hypothetical protein E2C01_081210 [Portunus trituberculatus]|uniref:Uncharacterized protein n=1 Tax=Portunus trituberculatus TaxID=210409 RepID=A0A5B7IV74_PORTR|nr:hypothetical protein [Portunus trituberculatus]